MGIIMGRGVCLLRILLGICAQVLICERFSLCDGLGQDYSYTYVVNLENIVSLHEEHSSLKRVTGSYSFLQPNGLIRTVQYKVDGNSGFQAAVQYRKHNSKPKGHLKFPRDFHQPIWLTVPVGFIPRDLLGPYRDFHRKRSS